MATQAEIEKSERMIKKIAIALDQVLNDEDRERTSKVGFAVICFNIADLQDDGERLVNYASNVDREAIVVALKEWIARQEGRYHEPRLEP